MAINDKSGEDIAERRWTAPGTGLSLAMAALGAMVFVLVVYAISHAVGG
jgi:hypothetical protein